MITADTARPRTRSAEERARAMVAVACLGTRNKGCYGNLDRQDWAEVRYTLGHGRRLGDG